MNVSFRDMLFLLVFMYLLIGGIALAHVHKKAEESKGAQPPGNVIVELRWAPEIDADVDLWVQGADGQVHEIVRSAAELSFQGQEVTVFRFRLDEKSEMAAGSLNRIHKDLRAAASSGVVK